MFDWTKYGANPHWLADQDLATRNRWDDFTSRPMNIDSVISGGRAIGGPLPDRAWDAFFGAAQRKGVNLDLVGRKGTSGIGRLKGQDLNTGKVYDMESGEVPPGLQQRRQPALQGLQSAIGRKY